MFAPQTMSPMAYSVPGTDHHLSHDGLRRSNSLTWRHEAGLPPPPSEIDQFPNLQQHMQPVNEAVQRTTSPFVYDDTNGMPNLNGEVMPMHAVTKHPKIKLKVLLANSIFEAGSAISGVLEITSSTSQRLRLGEIAVELEAFEELSSRDHAATQIFLFNRTLFQGEHLPPSNAVLPSAPIQGHWTARKGRTSFPFSFRLPLSAPSSCTFGGNANLRYMLKGTAQTWWNDSKSLVTVRSEAFVVERWHDELDPRYLEPAEAIADTHVFMGGSGAIWLEAGVSEQLFVAGSVLMIRAGVKNNSKRHLSGLKVCIARKLIFPASGLPGKPAQRPSLEPQITEVIHTQLFKGPSYEFPPNEEVVVNLAVDVPRELRSIRKTRLFEVQTVAIVSAQMGNFAKDLTVEIPVFVAHPGSIQHRRAAPHHQQAFEPLANLPQRSRSAMAQHGQHHNQPSPLLPTTPIPQQHQAFQDPAALVSQQPQAYHPDLSMSRIEAYAAQRGWSPAPFTQTTAHQLPSRPASAAPPQHAAAMVMLPAMPQPVSVQPSSQDPSMYQQRNAQMAEGWSSSTMLANAQPHQSIQAPARPWSAQDATSVQDDSAYHGRDHLNASSRREPTAGSTHLLTRQERHDQTANDNDTRYARESTQHRRHSAPASQEKKTLTSLPQSAPEEEEQQEILEIPYVPSPSQLLGPNGQPVGLATIDEDSESATGTVRSIRTLIGSVTRGDIDQFEEMARRAEDDEEARKAMQEVGMVPDAPMTRAAAAAAAIDEKHLPQKPEGTNGRRNGESSIRTQRHVKLSDVFEVAPVHQALSPRTVEASPIAPEKKDLPKQRPQQKQSLPPRPASAQGMGLNALGSRLNTTLPTQKAVLQSRKSEPVTGTKDGSSLSSSNRPLQVLANVRQGDKDKPIARQNTITAKTGSGQTAAEREQRSRREELARLQKETEEEELKRRKPTMTSIAEKELRKGATHSQKPEDARNVATSTHNASANLSVSSASTEKKQNGGERKTVDIKEQRKLTKEAVGRVDGWLSTSPSRELSRDNEGSVKAIEDVDLAMSPKTPSPSVLRAEPEEEEQTMEKLLALSPQTSSSSVLRSLATSSEKHAGERDDEGVILSADLRALIDATKTLPKPRKGTSISSHPSSVRLFSGDQTSGTKGKDKSDGSASTVKTTLWAPLHEKSSNTSPQQATSDANDADHIKVPASFVKTLTQGGNLQQSETSSKYDARSARGGRGGRVASVATMWASIADGTDGSQMKDTTPTLTLKPKALRTGAAKLDFSLAKSDELEQSPTCEESTGKKKRSTASAPFTFADNKVTTASASSKPSSAPHFVNTTMPKPIFSSSSSSKKQEEHAVAAPAPAASTTARVPPAPRALQNAAERQQDGKLKATRKITSDLIASEARMRAGRDLVKDAAKCSEHESGIDSVLLQPMNGRGTTKPIGRERLSDLRSLWGG